jgi:hypothetical protein
MRWHIDRNLRLVMLVHRFIALVVTALALTMTSAHVLEMAPKLAYSLDLYTVVNGTLYRYFAIVGGLYTVGSVIAVATLAWRVRRRSSSRWTVVAALFITGSFVSWLVLVQPVNMQIADAGPHAATVWGALRSRWEYGHLVGFILSLFGFCALVIATLVEVSRVGHARPEPARRHARGRFRRPPCVRRQYGTRAPTSCSNSAVSNTMTFSATSPSRSRIRSIPLI